MADTDILFTRAGGVGTVTLNRPHALNAFTLAMYRAFDPVLREWETDPDIRHRAERALLDRLATREIEDRVTWHESL